jgi:hypothetical protein
MYNIRFIMICFNPETHKLSKLITAFTVVQSFGTLQLLKMYNLSQYELAPMHPFSQICTLTFLNQRLLDFWEVITALKKNAYTYRRHFRANQQIVKTPDKLMLRWTPFHKSMQERRLILMECQLWAGTIHIQLSNRILGELTTFFELAYPSQTSLNILRRCFCKVLRTSRIKQTINNYLLNLQVDQVIL